MATIPDYHFGVSKVYGAARPEEALTLSMDFWSVSTAINILSANDASGNGNADSQAALNKLVEIISLNGQPVILTPPTVADGVYTVHFAIEHAGSWAVPGAPSASAGLLAAIKADGIGYGFADDTTLAASLSNTLPASSSSNEASVSGNPSSTSTSGTSTSGTSTSGTSTGGTSTGGTSTGGTSTSGA